MSWPTLGRLVLVDWLDSNGTKGWHDPDVMLAAARGSMACQTVGWVLYEDDDRLALVPSQAEAGSLCDVTTIPKIVITKITELLRMEGTSLVSGCP